MKPLSDIGKKNASRFYSSALNNSLTRPSLFYKN